MIISSSECRFSLLSFHLTSLLINMFKLLSLLWRICPPDHCVLLASAVSKVLREDTNTSVKAHKHSHLHTLTLLYNLCRRGTGRPLYSKKRLYQFFLQTEYHIKDLLSRSVNLTDSYSTSKCTETSNLKGALCNIFMGCKQTK